MTKRIPLKDIIANEIDKRWQLFDTLGKKAKEIDKEKDHAKLDTIYTEMRELALDMECMENYVLDKHPEATQLWHTLKELTFKEYDEKDI